MYTEMVRSGEITANIDVYYRIIYFYLISLLNVFIILVSYFYLFCSKLFKRTVS